MNSYSSIYSISLHWHFLNKKTDNRTNVTINVRYSIPGGNTENAKQTCSLTRFMKTTCPGSSRIQNVTIIHNLKTNCHRKNGGEKKQRGVAIIFFLFLWKSVIFPTVFTNPCREGKWEMERGRETESERKSVRKREQKNSLFSTYH